MMWLTVSLSIFTVTSAIKVPVVPKESSLENYTLTKTYTPINLKGKFYKFNLPQVKHRFLNSKKETSFNNLKLTYIRPRNLIRLTPNFKPNFQVRKNWIPIVTSKTTVVEGEKLKRKKKDVERDDENFTPTQLLSQVRHTKNEEHLPQQEEDPHLREVIKDTKVHVEYTEEGYEDIGYDHAGEERNEENNGEYRSQTQHPSKKKEYGQLQVDIAKEFDNYEKVNHSDEVNDDDDEDEEISNSNKSKRTASFTNDFSTIDINDYLSDVKEIESLAPTTKKYPYYNLQNRKIFNENSALRYGEDIKNIPKKVGGDLSFYKHTGASKCDKIILNVDLSSKENRTANSTYPRLKNLGKNILCLKTKYFGDNPLDNPLFLETRVAAPRPFMDTFRSKRSLASDATLMKKNDIDETLPESAPLRLRKRKRKYPLRSRFGTNTYLPTPVPHLPFSSTVLPKYKTISEVYYKDEIQPNEQLNVFADVMNNIKKIRTDLVTADTEFVEDKNVYPVENQKKQVKIKVPTRKIKIKSPNTGVRLPERSTTTTTTEKPVTRRRHNYRNHKPDAQVYEEYINTIGGSGKEENVDFAESQLEEVIGLSPPVIELSTPVPHKISLNGATNHKKVINTFPVSGMKPPINHNPLIYSHFINSKHARRKVNHVIYKRSAQKPAYLEIRRNKPEIVDEEDDYVPKRNRNFHYDIKSKQVIYLMPKNENEEEEEEEYEEATTKFSRERKVTVPSTTTTTAAGPSFLDYVYQLKTHNQYQYIMEPTEKPKEITTKTTLKTTNQPLQENRPIPDFLNIVSMVKKNKAYMAIPEKTTKTSVEKEFKKIGTEEEEEQIESNFEQFGIFDVTDYLPKQDNYAPVTIDYSKYKSIERKRNDNLEEDSETNSDNTRSDFLAHPRVVTTTSTTESPLTTTPRSRLRTRRRPVTTSLKVTDRTTTSTIPSTRSRRRFRSTTPSTTEFSRQTDYQAQRNVRRRLHTTTLEPNRRVPSNHKEKHTPIAGVDLLSEEKEEPTEPNLSSNTPLTQNDNKRRVNVIKDPSKRLYYYAPVK